MKILLRGYCQRCGQTLGAPGACEGLCADCRAGWAGQALAHFPSRAEAELLAPFDIESALRLRRLRRRVRARRGAGGRDRGL